MINFNEIGMVMIRSVLAILVLLLTSKMLGKKQISQLTFYDYVVGITIGSLAADIILNLDHLFVNGVAAIILFGIIGLFISILSIKNNTINELLNGKPTILMEDGNFVLENLRKTKIPISKFIEQARLNGYFDISVLNYAILETNGEISFLPKEEFQTSTPIDFKLELKKGTKQSFCEVLMIHGNVKYDKLTEIGKSEKWLKDELKKKKINDFEQVLLVTFDEKEKMKIYKDN